MNDLAGMYQEIKILNEKELLQKKMQEQVVTSANMNDDPLNVNKFVCKKCGWNATATMVSAPTKCGGCGIHDYLERAVVITAKGKVKNPQYIKFNPDTNKYKKLSNMTESDIQEKIDDIMKKIESKEFLQKDTDYFNGIKKEDKMEEKKLVKICRNKNHCGAYGIPKPLEHSKDGSASGDKFCRFCGMSNTIAEK